MRVVAVVNQKGGVGKTTTAINLSTAVAAFPQRVLLIDSDPQGNAATGLGMNKGESARSLYHALLGNISIEDVIFKTQIPGLDMICSHIDLAAAEIELSGAENSRQRLKEMLGRIAHLYDYVFIDCPPSVGLLTINALVASSSILIPLQCEFFALEGIKHLLQTYKLVKTNLNPALEIDGVLLTMYDRRTSLTELVEKDVRACLGNVVYKTVIPRNITLVESQSYGKPVLIYDMNSTGATAYIEMAKEFLERNLNKVGA